MAKAKPIKITPVSEQEAQSLYGDVEPQPFAAVGFEGGGGGGGPVDWEDIENKPNLADGDVYQYLEVEAGGEIIAAGFIAKSFDIGSPGNTESLDQLAINADQTVVSGGVKVNGDLQVIGDEALFMADVEIRALEVRNELRLRSSSSAV